VLSKNKLREEFSKSYGKYYSTKLFDKEGFTRKKCKVCGKGFWTADSARELCGDPEHEPYSFIREKPANVSYLKFWKTFSDFFKRNKHTIIESYPVVSRWRQDLYFTMSGIQDFQRIENGRMSFEYPANPLLVPQICLRFNDISNVGVNGRYFTSFMMANQTAFNHPKEGYWREKTIELNYNLLVNILKVNKKNLTYIEDVWAMGDFSEFGPCLEFFSNGLELGNNVFTQFEYVNGKISELKGKVVDVGWGFERNLWFAAGTQTAYDAVFPSQLTYLYKSSGIKPDYKLYSHIAKTLSKIDFSGHEHIQEQESAIVKTAGISKHDFVNVIKPMQALYAIADHTRTLLFAINDGALPSNVGGGYNLRMLLRRVFDFLDEYEFNIDIAKLLEIHAKELGGIYNGIGDNIDEMGKIFDVEKRRYQNTKSSALKTVNQLIAKKEPVTTEKLRTLYESNGITPEFIGNIAAKSGIRLEIPEGAYSSMVKGDFVARQKHQKELMDVGSIKPTKNLFYNFENESQAKVLKSQGNMLILNQTPFYAESGGQEADHGTIDGTRVVDVQNLNGVIVHVLEKPIRAAKGKTVHCVVDVQRRQRLMAHHTATHLISAAARKVLGKHAWQEGAKKTQEKAHIDIAHYEPLSEHQIKAIEDTANNFILNGIKVAMREMPRGEAESKFGFSIYQGHGAPSGKLRIVVITNLQGMLIDAEACGGLHLMGRESSIGIIKITGSARIHDGINRLEFVAGSAALEYINKMSSSVKELSKLANTSVDNLTQGISQQLNAINTFRKENMSMAKQLSIYIANDLLKEGKQVIKKMNHNREMLRLIATSAVEKENQAIVMLFNDANEIVCIAGNASNQSAIDFVKANLHRAMPNASFVGGGSQRIAEGRLKPS